MKALIAACAMLLAQSACAGAGGFHPSLAASYLHFLPDDSAFEIGAAGAVALDPDGALELGPRASFLTGNGEGQSRQSVYLGAQANLWVMNFFAPGLGADWVPMSSLDRDDYRFELMLDTRLMHVGSGGALALRIGVPYEESLRWGFLAGVTLEFL